jgi:hypothetical protein
MLFEIWKHQTHTSHCMMVCDEEHITADYHDMKPGHDRVMAVLEDGTTVVITRVN